MSPHDVPQAVPLPHLDCRAQSAIDALQLKRYELAVRQNKQRRAAAAQRAVGRTLKVPKFTNDWNPATNRYAK